MRALPLFALLAPLLLSSLYLLAARVARPPTDLRPKVFVIGTSKTGTTSIGNALAMLGYRRLGWRDIRSRQLVHAFIHRDLDALAHITQYYDAFEDLPWPGAYREMAERYPDARFVLSLRRDDHKWLNSLRAHLARGTWAPADFWYGAQQVAGSEEVVLQKYRNHTAAVREFFADQPHRYVELVVEDGDAGWDTLCRVAQCPQGGRVPAVPFPKSNTIAHWRDDELSGRLHRLRGQLWSFLEVYLARIYDSGSYPLFNRFLEGLWHVVNVVEMAINNIYFAVATQEPLPVK